MDEVSVTVTDAPAEGRFEARLPDGVLVALAAYDVVDDAIVFTHTEVDQAYEGRGIAAQLVGEALDSVRGRGLRVVPLCPYVRAFLRRHPEYADLVDPPAAHLPHQHQHPVREDEGR